MSFLLQTGRPPNAAARSRLPSGHLSHSWQGSPSNVLPSMLRRRSDGVRSSAPSEKERRFCATLVNSRGKGGIIEYIYRCTCVRVRGPSVTRERLPTGSQYQIEPDGGYGPFPRVLQSRSRALPEPDERNATRAMPSVLRLQAPRVPERVSFYHLSSATVAVGCLGRDALLAPLGYIWICFLFAW